MAGMQTMMLNKKKKKKQGSPNWWWLDTHNNNNNNNSDATGRASWLQSTLSELDEKTTTMLKLIETDADSFAQRAEMYYRKRPDLIAVVEEFYRMHRSLAERFDQLKSDSTKRLLMTLGSRFSCTEEQVPVPPIEKPLLLSLGVYKNTDPCSESSDDCGDNPEEDKSGGKPVVLDIEALSRALGDDQTWTLKEEIERLSEENRMLRKEMARKDVESKQALGRMSILVFKISRQRDEMARREEQKVKDEKNTRDTAQPLGAAPAVAVPKAVEEEEKISIQMKLAAVVLNPIRWEQFLRRLFPKSSDKSKATSALSFGTF